MNTIYRIVWNASTHSWVVASELTKAKRKGRVMRSTAAAFVAATMALGGQVHASDTAGGNDGAGGSSTVSIAIGTNSSATSFGTTDSSMSTIYPWSIARPDGYSNYYGSNAIAMGWGAIADSSASKWSSAIAIGGMSYATGRGTAVGGFANASADYATALGVAAYSAGWSTSVGAISEANGTYASALGYKAWASGLASTALGQNSIASADYSVALGSRSTTTADLTTPAYNPGNATLQGTASAANGEVSIGSSTKERRLTNLAAGSAPTDAVNVSQLQSQDAEVDSLGATTATALGGGASYDAGTGSITAPSYALSNTNTIAGTTGAATDVGTGFSKVDTALGKLNTQVTNTNRYFKANGLNNGTDDAVNNGALAIGANSRSGIWNDVAIGQGAVADSTAGNNPVNSALAIGYNANASASAATAVGLGSTVQGSSGQAFGRFSWVEAGVATGTALGGRATVNANNAVALGASSYADRANTVSVGSDTTYTDVSGVSHGPQTRQLVNMAAGTQSNDAVNVSQLTSVVNALGGGAAIDGTTGAVSGPSYALSNANSIDGTSGAATDVGTGFSKVDSALGKLNTQVINTNRYFKASGLNNGADDAVNNGALAIGANSKSGTWNDIAIGPGAVADSTAGNNPLNSSMAIGYNANASAGFATAVGLGSTVQSNSGQAFGRYSWVEASATTGTALGGRATVNANNAVALGAMSYADRANTVSVGSDTAYTDVSGTTYGPQTRQLVNMAAGAQSTDAVNVSQLTPVVTALGGGAALNSTTGAVTGPSYALSNANTIAGTTGAATDVGTGFGKVDAALDTLNTEVAQNSSNIAGNTTSINNITSQINNGRVGLVQQAAAGENLTVGKDTDGVAVDFADKNGNTRTLKNVTAGVADTDAVNMSQLKATNANVAQNTSDIAGNTTAITNLDNRVTTNEGDISTLNTNVSNIDARVTQNTGDISTINTTIAGMNGQLADAVMYDSLGHDKVTLGNAGTPVQLDNVKAGDLSAGSLEAVNGSQLYATNQQVAQNTSDIAGNTSSITNLDGRVTQNTTDIAGNTTSINNLQNTVNNISSGTAGLVQQTAAGENLTVGKDTDGAAVDFAGTAGARKLINVADGTVTSGSQEAVNGGQLHGVSQSVANAIGGGSTVNSDGTISAPSYDIHNADGSTSTVNNVGAAITNIDGRVTQNTTDIAGNTTAITNLDNRVTTNDGDISSLQTTVNNISSGTVGLVQQAAAGADLTVGKDTDGVAVDFADKSGATRTLKNVTAGVADTDAVNMSQLNATNANVAQNTSDIAGNTTSITDLDNRVTTNEGDISTLNTNVSNIDARVTQNTGDITTINSTINTMNGQLADAVMYDSSSHDKVTLGNAGTPVQLGNVKASDLSADSLEAVNGSQLYATNQQVAQNTSDIAGNTSSITNLDGRVTQNTTDITNLQNNINTGTVGLVQQGGAGADLMVGKDTDGVAVDFADKNGNTRTLKNVTAGVADTDAVNMSQLNATNANVAQNTSDIAGNTTAITNLDNRVTTTEGGISTLNTSVSNIDARVTQNTGDIAGNTTSITNLDGRVTQNTTDITNLQKNISAGTVGLVQQAAVGADLTVGKDTDGVAVDFADKSGATRTLKNVTAGVADTDAVNMSQLNAANANVAQNTSDIAGNTTAITNLDSRVTTNEGDISTLNTNVSNIDGRVTQNTGDISTINTTIASMNGELADAVMYDSSAHDKVTLGNAGTPVQLGNVKAGDLSAGSLEAVNGSQLYATNQQVAQNTSDIAGNTSSINNLQNTVNNISSGTVGLVQQSAAGADLTMGKDTDGVAVNFADKNGNTRTLKNVTAGVADTDAVNMSQLNATNANVAQNTSDIAGNTTAITNLDNRVTTNEGDISTLNTNVSNIDARVTQNTSDIAGNTTSITNLDGRVTQNTTDITNLQNNINTGTVGLVQQAVAGADLTVGKDTDGVAVDFADKNGATRTLKNVTAGVTDTDAVNMSQLNATNANVASNTANIAANTANIATATANLGNLGSMTAAALGGGTTYDPTTGSLSGTSFGLTNANAINGTSGAATDVGTGFGKVDAALGTLNTEVTQNTTNIANNTASINNISNQINSGTIGLVQQSAAGANLTVGKDTDGAAVDFAGTAGARKLVNVADGAVTDGSKEAVNGGQLHGVSQSVANAIGGGSTVNSDGSISAPRYDIHNADGSTTTANSVGDAITNLDSRTYSNTTAISDLSQTINNITNNGAGIKYFHSNSTQADAVASGVNAVAVGGNAQASASNAVAVGSGAQATQANSVALGSGSTTSAVTATTGGTVAGTNYTYAGGTPTGTVSVGSAGSERTVTNVAAGQVSATSTDAVNGSQLYATNQAVNQLDGRMGNVENNLSNVTNTVNTITNSMSSGQSGMFQVSADSKSTQPVASGARSTAGGNGAVASGAGSTAVGNGAQATGSNSVAIGADSVADRDNTVSVGAAGKERQITNVAAGTADTDAVNVSQLKSAGVINSDGSANQTVTYDHNADGSTSVTLNSGGDPTIIHNVAAGQVSTDAATVGQVDQAMQQTANWAKNYTDRQVANVSRQARAGSAAAIAVASLPQAYQPGQNSAGVAFGTYQGQNAVSMGMSAISASGRYIVKVSFTGAQHSGAGAGIGAGMVW